MNAETSAENSLFEQAANTAQIEHYPNPMPMQRQLHQHSSDVPSTSSVQKFDDNYLSSPRRHQAKQHRNLDAVIIRNLVYQVGSRRKKKKRKTILDQICLTVPEGSIYGLLGPSGCGKTTMLRCVVGRLKPNSGCVLVFGNAPNSADGEIPGPAIGYMPQEISIYDDFTIEETLHYFGRVNRMSTAAINSRTDFLLQFLDLPLNRFVANLSGGQKRRVSLAAALVHSPPLLILDEPTVGVDPLLRQSIWQHLVTLTKRERISVIITTHYIEEARQADVVGLMRRGKILAEANPNFLMQKHKLNSLEDVFLKLCITDAARKAATLATSDRLPSAEQHSHFENWREHSRNEPLNAMPNKTKASQIKTNFTESNVAGREVASAAYVNEAVEIFSSEDENDEDASNFKHAGSGCQFSDNKNNATSEASFFNETLTIHQPAILATKSAVGKQQTQTNTNTALQDAKLDTTTQQSQFNASTQRDRDIQHELDAATSSNENRNKNNDGDEEVNLNEYLASQVSNWAFRRAHKQQVAQQSNTSKDLSFLNGKQRPSRSRSKKSEFSQWFETLRAVTWKNYVRLRRNPPVLVFQFMLPAVQVILFCSCIGGKPFDVPLAVVNDELPKPQSSIRFLNDLSKTNAVKQIKYDNLTSAIQAVKDGEVWGALHIPSSYSKHLQSRLLQGDEVSNETISNGTIRVYPDLTNLHLALALESTFRESFINFARDSLQDLGYDRSLADLPIQIGKPIYGSTKKDGGYLEFMAPGVVISISYVMATGLTSLAFILERRDGMLERSLVSGVQTSQILLGHAINQIVVMVIQIFMVLGCVFFVFEIPSQGPFSLVVLLILLQGCTGMAFGLLVSAICTEENTAVMMLVGTFYTNLILAGIIWPIEAMPHWLRPLSWLQPQTLSAETLRHILSRGWNLSNFSVVMGFAATIGWLLVFFFAAGLIFKYKG